MGKKIIHIITRLDKGGSADIVLKLSAELKNRGYDVGILSGLTTDPVADIEGFTKKTGIEIKFIPYLQRNINPLKDIQTFLYLFKLLRREKPLIAHLHTSKAGFIGRLAAKLAGVKCIVYTTHGHIFYGYFSRIKTRLFINMERLASFFCDAITTLTEKEKREFLNLNIAKKCKIIPVPNGLDISLFSEAKKGTIRRELGINDETFLIGWVGRFEPVKGPDIFLSVCKKLHDMFNNGVMAVMAGNGALFDDIRKKRDMLGLNKFLLLLGYRNDISPLFADIDILVLTSLNEGFGMVILESMAAGKPVISHNVGGVSDLIVDNATGYMVKKGDIDAIANHVKYLIENRDIYNSLSVNAYNLAIKYSLSEMVSKFEEVYNSVLSAAKYNGGYSRP
ncbi:MAG: glycosyltransferase family 4 protein [Deltaproteobacteria bacterium]|nr:glycosyltransferase family 4 protein [Deltaproteobacteria bacterium]